MEVKLKASLKSQAVKSPFMKWLLEGGVDEPEGAFESDKHGKHKTHAWWQVMCLTGVDYFSTLGYQPSIAFSAAGALSPIATIVLVLITLFGALPVYQKVAEESPHGEGSISMLQKLLSWWQGKLFVLVLLGFAATDFVITMTLSAADATQHLVENPHLNSFLEGKAVPLTLALLSILAGVFLKGFKEAIGIAVLLVVAYLALNSVVLFRGMEEIFRHPDLIPQWQKALFETKAGSNPAAIALLVLVIFPKLALGLSGFETGVAVISLVEGKKSDTEERPVGRIKNTQKLLMSAAVIMSVFLIASSFVTSLLIPASAFASATKDSPAGEANGRALAYIAHKYLGDGFGTVYDVSTVLILWFAGASAMAGLLNLVPRYLPKFGMAPEWTRANRPVVLIFAAISFLVTIIFKANVDAQGGAYATGVLVLMSSAAIAVTIAVKKGHKLKRLAFGTVALIFVYTTIMNIIERPDGIRIALMFILGIITISFFSRIWRTLELRVTSVDLDLRAITFVRDVGQRPGSVRIIPNRPEEGDSAEYARKTEEVRRDHDIPADAELLFVEVIVGDASNFTGDVTVKGVMVDGYKVLRCQGIAIPNTIAAIMLHIGQLTGKRPHAYFSWGEQSPLLFLMKYFLSGEGDIAPVCREIIRRVEPNGETRPVIHAAS